MKNTCMFSGHLMRSLDGSIRSRIWVLTIVCLAAVAGAAAHMPNPAWLVRDINLTVDPYMDVNPTTYTQVGDTLFFISSDPYNGTELWRSDGTPDGMALVRSSHHVAFDRQMRDLLGLASTALR